METLFFFTIETTLLADDPLIFLKKSFTPL